MDLEDMSVTPDHRDDLTHEMVFDILITDMRSRGISFQMPTDPRNDQAFVRTLIEAFDPGLPVIMPPEYGMAAE